MYICIYIYIFITLLLVNTQQMITVYDIAVLRTYAVTVYGMTILYTFY